MIREVAAQFLTLAEKQGAIVPLMIGNRLMGASLLLTGYVAESRAHLDRAIALYDPKSCGSSPDDHLRDHRRSFDGNDGLLAVVVIEFGGSPGRAGQLDEAWRCIGKAMSTIETTKERWFEAEANRMAGEIALLSPEPDTAKAEAYFERALAVARQQHAKSWELRAAMSMARLWRDQSKRKEARELLAPVYGWFTEGFDTLDLKEAKVLLDELAS
jgi:tetratricopeptide (TPR) repeat protein